MLPENDTVSGPCRLGECPDERVAFTLFCRPHLNDYRAGHIGRLSDGSYAGTAVPRDERPAWVRNLAHNARELSGGRAA